MCWGWRPEFDGALWWLQIIQGYAVWLRWDNEGGAVWNNIKRWRGAGGELLEARFCNKAGLKRHKKSEEMMKSTRRTQFAFLICRCWYTFGFSSSLTVITHSGAHTHLSEKNSPAPSVPQIFMKTKATVAGKWPCPSWIPFLWRSPAQDRDTAQILFFSIRQFLSLTDFPMEQFDSLTHWIRPLASPIHSAVNPVLWPYGTAELVLQRWDKANRMKLFPPLVYKSDSHPPHTPRYEVNEKDLRDGYDFRYLCTGCSHCPDFPFWSFSWVHLYSFFRPVSLGRLSWSGATVAGIPLCSQQTALSILFNLQELLLELSVKNCHMCISLMSRIPLCFITVYYSIILFPYCTVSCFWSTLSPKTVKKIIITVTAKNNMHL